MHGLGRDRWACPMQICRLNAAALCSTSTLPGVWLERGRIDAADARLMNGPLGLADQRCILRFL